MDKLARRIGRRISELRRKRNITSESVAYGAGFSKGYLSNIENGKKLPSLAMLQKIADELEVDIKELF